ncbi:MAG: PAP2 family protein [Ignavibacteriaceae bacterium]|nr:PAP2 family protein [Ignavibacteria bacterium]MBT8391704.1 PAP2 family protein [Ignavibacteria bacterium]NNJ54246.1 PAP2 family protein [Ignavibacteriaceae bacterium]NNL22741.1 PAP2 family protein [Ignavibacteriaceae bacterium]
MKVSSERFARIISTLFVPPSFTIILFALFAFTLETGSLQKIITILTAFIFGFSAQIILFVIFRKRGRIADLDASVKEERTTPFVISTGFYIIGLIILINFNVHIFSIAFWFCYISNTLVTIFINKHWKISAHAMGAAGPLAAAVYVFGPIAFIFSLIVFLVGWSRIQLKAHNFAQVLAGILLGFISTYLQIYFIVKWFN